MKKPKFQKIGPNTYLVSFGGCVVGVVQREPLKRGWSAFDNFGKKWVDDYPGSRKTAGSMLLSLREDLVKVP